MSLSAAPVQDGPASGTVLRRLLGTLSQGRRLDPQGGLKWFVDIFSLAILAYLIWYAVFGVTNRHLNGSIFLFGVSAILFLTATRNRRTAHIGISDWLLAALSLAIGTYYALNDQFYATLMEGMTPIPSHEMAIGVAAIAVVAEACRRTIGWGLTSVFVVLIVYTAFGHLLPGALGQPGVAMAYFTTVQTVTTEGLFGPAIEAAATYAVLFVTFGTFFQRTGGGELFFALATAVTGSSRGGASKACAVSSGLYGSISGSPVADVVTTGPVTIPLMRRMGVSPERAAGIEAAAASGGSILPPVMGSVAFLMVEYTNIDYRVIALAALVPALLYYGGVMFGVHLEAIRHGEAPLPFKDRIPLWRALGTHWRHIITLVVLVTLLVSGLSVPYVAATSLLLLVALSWTSRRAEYRLGPLKILDVSGDTIRQIAALAAACGVSGVVIGCMILTGLNGKFSLMMSAASGGMFITALFVAAVLLIVLGLGLPTASVYILGVALIAPVLIQQYQVPLLEAHLFMVFYGSVSGITPPLATTCFAAASLAGANPDKTAWYSCKLGLGGFTVPFFFVYHPGLLMQGTPQDIAYDVATGAIMVAASTLALFGARDGAELRLPWRLVFGALAVLLTLGFGVPQALAGGAVLALAILYYLGLLPGAEAPSRTMQRSKA